MAAYVGSLARLLRGEAGKRGAPSEIVTMDLLGGCGGGSGGEDEVVDLEVKVPAGWERRLDLLSGKTFLTPRHQGGQDVHQDLNLPPPADAAPATSAAVCTLDMVRSALERATAGRAAGSPATSSSSSASSSSSSSSVGKRNRSPPASTATPANPSMRAAACPSCLTYVLIVRVLLLVFFLRGKAQPLAACKHGDARKPVHAGGRVPLLPHVRAHHRGRPPVPALRSYGAAARWEVRRCLRG